MRQTNHEGELLDWLNAAADDATPGRPQRRRVDALLLRALRRLRPADRAAGRGAHQRPGRSGRRSSGTPRWSRRTPSQVIAGQGIDGYREALALIGRPPEPREHRTSERHGHRDLADHGTSPAAARCWWQPPVLAVLVHLRFSSDSSGTAARALERGSLARTATWAAPGRKGERRVARGTGPGTSDAHDLHRHDRAHRPRPRRRARGWTPCSPRTAARMADGPPRRRRPWTLTAPPRRRVPATDRHGAMTSLSGSPLCAQRRARPDVTTQVIDLQATDHGRQRVDACAPWSRSQRTCVPCSTWSGALTERRVGRSSLRRAATSAGRPHGLARSPSTWPLRTTPRSAAGRGRGRVREQAGAAGTPGAVMTGSRRGSARCSRSRSAGALVGVPAWLVVRAASGRVACKAPARREPGQDLPRPTIQSRPRSAVLDSEVAHRDRHGRGPTELPLPRRRGTPAWQRPTT